MDRHEWDDRYSVREPTFPLEPNRLVVAEVSQLAPGAAIDLATGEGRHAVWLASLGWRVVAIDFALVGLRRAQARAEAEGHSALVAIGAADVHALRFPEGRFDLVLASFFHPRPPERAALYRSVAGALVPGGSLLMVSYDKTNLTEGSGGPQDPDLLLDPPQFAAELEALGLRVMRAETVPLRITTAEGEEVPVVNAVIRAVRP